MLGRLALAGVVLVSIGSSAAFAGPFIPLWFLNHQCAHQARQSQCAYQVMYNENGGSETTKQVMVVFGNHRSTQLAVTIQTGSNNNAYIGQFGGDQIALSVQDGDNNGSFTYQQGHDQASVTTENGSGQWSATSSIGHGTTTSVALTSF